MVISRLFFRRFQFLNIEGSVIRFVIIWQLDGIFSCSLRVSTEMRPRTASWARMSGLCHVSLASSEDRWQRVRLDTGLTTRVTPISLWANKGIFSVSRTDSYWSCSAREPTRCFTTDPWRFAPVERQVIEDEVQCWATASSDPHSSQGFFPVEKFWWRKNGTIYFCVHYRKRNSAAKRDMYLLLRIDALYFSTRIWSADTHGSARTRTTRKKKPISTPRRLYQLKGMLMDKIVGPLKYQTNLVYFVGIIVYPRDFDISMTHVQKYWRLSALLASRLKAKNYTFIIRKMNHLGYKITAGGYFPDRKISC